MKKLLLISLFASFCLSTNSAQEELMVSIYRPFKPFGIVRTLGNEHLKTIIISISDFSDETTIAELKKKIAQKAGISIKKLSRNALLTDGWRGEEYENNKTCQYYNLREEGHIRLVLPSNHGAIDFFRSVAMIPGAAMYAVCHKFIP